MTSHTRVFTFLASCLVLGALSDALAAGFALEEGSARGNVDPGELTAKGGEPGSLYFQEQVLQE